MEGLATVLQRTGYLDCSDRARPLPADFQGDRDADQPARSEQRREPQPERTTVASPSIAGGGEFAAIGGRPEGEGQGEGELRAGGVIAASSQFPFSLPFPFGSTSERSIQSSSYPSSSPSAIKRLPSGPSCVPV